MQQGTTPEGDPIEFAMKMITECYDVLFDQASVMMHAINREGYLVKVNQRWLSTLGYEIDETMGRKSVDFVTDESRWRALQETMPLFWRTGSARSIGYEFVRKNGRVLDVLLNADPEPRHTEAQTGLGTIWALDDQEQRQQGLTTVKMLQNIAQIEHRFEELLVATQLKDQATGPATQPRPSSEHSEVTSAQAGLAGPVAWPEKCRRIYVIWLY